MIVLQVSLNFDPVNEILKIQCHFYISMKHVIILRKIHVTMNSFIPPFSTVEENWRYSRFSCRYIKYSIRVGDLNWCKCRHCKNEAKEIECLCCRDVDSMLTALAKVPQCEGSILLSSLTCVGICKTISHSVSLIYLVDQFFFFFLV